MTAKSAPKPKPPQRRAVASALRKADIDTLHIPMLKTESGILIKPPAHMLKECRAALVEAGATLGRSTKDGLLCTALAVIKRQGQRIPKVLSRDDATRLVNAPLADLTDPRGDRRWAARRNHVAFYLMRRWGLRESECCALTIADVDLDQGYILVQSGKGDKDRSFTIDEQTVALITDWLEHRGDYAPRFSVYLLATTTGGPMATSYLRERCSYYSKAIGVYVRDKGLSKPVQPHTFRHCAATELLEDGYSLPEVQAILGHSTIQVTSVYLHCRPQAMKEKARNRPPMMLQDATNPPALPLS